MFKDEYACYIGKTFDHKGNERFILLGKKYFAPLIVTIKKQADKSKIKLGDTLYIGSKTRDYVNTIVKRADPETILNLDRKKVMDIIESMVKEREEYFLRFFNEAEAYSIKRHSLELLPGVGSRLLKHILEERSKKPFKSFKDIDDRCLKIDIPFKSLNSITKRIYFEITSKTREKIFTK